MLGSRETFSFSSPSASGGGLVFSGARGGEECRRRGGGVFFQSCSAFSTAASGGSRRRGSRSSRRAAQPRKHKHVEKETKVRNPMKPSYATVGMCSAADAGVDLLKKGCLYTPEGADPRMLAATAVLCRRYRLCSDEDLMER